MNRKRGEFRVHQPTGVPIHSGDPDSRTCWDRNERAGLWALLASILLSLAGVSPAAEAMNDLLSAQTSFNIPAQPLGLSLKQLADQAGIQILFEEQVVSGLQAPAIKIRGTALEALNTLLKGTGLEFAAKDATVAVRRRSATSSASSALNLQGSAGGTDEHYGRGGSPDGVSLSPREGKGARGAGMRLAQADSQSSEGPSAQGFSQDVGSRAALQEIVVTANKREEQLSKVPISIAALTTDAMEASGVKSFRDVAALTPGVQFDNVSSWGPNLANIAIRGVNSTIGTSTTGIYFDETPIQSRVQSFSYVGQPLPFTFDLDRVEVARGPQGTLFGAGAEGGSVRFIPVAPSLTQTSGVLHSEFAGTSNGGPSYEFGAAGGGPLVEDKIGFRASAWFRRDGGYVDRVDPFTGASVESNSNSSQSKSARFALALAPAEGFRITPSISYQEQDSHDTGTFYEALSDLDTGVLENGRLLRQPSQDQFYLPSLKIEARFPFADLTAITSYFHRKAFTLYDNTNILGALLGGYGSPLGPAYPVTPADAAPGYIDLRQSFVTQEVRFTSTDAAARLSWVGGVFFSRSRQEDTESIFTDVFTTQNPILYTDQNVRDTQYAAFGQLDYKFTGRLELSTGLRVARTQYSATQNVAGDLNAGVPPTASGSASETPVTPKVGLSFQATPNDLFYASVAKGYRIGGINTPLATYCGNIVAPQTYDSDSVWSYEIGAKNLLLDGHLQIDSSAFHINWKGIQQPVLIPACGFEYFANLGAATSNGFDLAVRALVAERLTLGIAVAYTDAHYTKTVSSDGVVTVDKDDAVGTVPQVPSPWNVTASSEYTFRLPGEMTATVRVEDIYHSRNPGPFSSQNPAAISYAPNIPPNPSTNVLNLRATFALRALDLEIFANNALNSLPALLRNQDSNSSDLYYRTTFRPRTVGVSASWHF